MVYGVQVLMVTHYMAALNGTILLLNGKGWER
jgi:hypothetical protein